MNLDFYLTSETKFNLRCVKGLNVKACYWVLGENRGEYLCDLREGRLFLGQRK